MNLEGIEWGNADAKEYLRELGGSKSGAHAFLQDACPELRKHLPSNTHYLEHGGDIEQFLDKIDDTQPVIVRGCHRLDVTGMVDVIPTFERITGREAIRAAIRRVLAAGQREDVKSFAQYESGKPFQGDIGILVQDNPITDTGSIIEHPHNRGVYRIGFSDIYEGTYDENGREFDMVGVKKNGERRTVNNAVDISPYEDSAVQQIIDLYRKVRDTGLMPDTYSFQMEFGWKHMCYDPEDLLFFQARLFRPFQPFADFDPFDQAGHCNWRGLTLPFNVFGITPSEGSPVMHRAELSEYDISYRHHEDNVAYAYNNYLSHDSAPLNVQPRNMAAYMPYQSNVLIHGHFRWIQKAALSFINKGGLLKNKRWPGASPERMQDTTEDIALRFFSDGFVGVVRFE